MTNSSNEAKTPLATDRVAKDIQLDADSAEERVRVQPRASFQPPEHCADCAAGVPFGADGHHTNQVSQRTRLIREQQRSEIGKAITAIMVSCSAESDARASDASKEYVRLAQTVIQEASDCDNCDNVALWDRWDNPETHWEACDKHKGDSRGWVERKAVRMALALISQHSPKVKIK